MGAASAGDPSKAAPRAQPLAEPPGPPLGFPSAMLSPVATRWCEEPGRQGAGVLVNELICWWGQPRR